MRYPRSIMSLTLLLNAITYYDPAGITVGYMLPTSKKMRIMGLKHTFTSSPTVWYNSIWPYCSPSLTGNFQVLINKAVDLLSMETAASQQAFVTWQDFLSQSPQITAIDPLTKCKDWLTRAQFFRTLNECVNVEVNGIKFRTPGQLDVNRRSDLTSLNISFPVIVKANAASVTKLSHIMSLVFNPQGLKEAIEIYDEECIVQEFVNHDMTVYKIYVIGSHIEYKPRSSCSNISGSNKNLVTFNSAEPWPEDIKSGQRVIKDLDREALQVVTKRISEHLALSIFGYDILVHSETGEYIVVDVNVFPGFKEYQDLNPLLETLITQKLSSH